MLARSRHRLFERLLIHSRWRSRRTVIPFRIGTNGDGVGDAVKSNCLERGAGLCVDFEIGTDFGDNAHCVSLAASSFYGSIPESAGALIGRCVYCPWQWAQHEHEARCGSNTCADAERDGRTASHPKSTGSSTRDKCPDADGKIVDPKRGAPGTKRSAEMSRVRPSLHTRAERVPSTPAGPQWTAPP